MHHGSCARPRLQHMRATLVLEGRAPHGRRDFFVLEGEGDEALVVFSVLDFPRFVAVAGVVQVGDHLAAARGLVASTTVLVAGIGATSSGVLFVKAGQQLLG